MFSNMLLISVGVVISSYGEIHFNIVGTVYQVTGIFAEALRLVLTQVLLQKKGLTLNPINSLYYIAPCRYSLLNLDAAHNYIFQEYSSYKLWFDSHWFNFIMPHDLLLFIECFHVIFNARCKVPSPLPHIIFCLKICGQSFAVLFFWPCLGMCWSNPRWKLHRSSSTFGYFSPMLSARLP